MTGQTGKQMEGATTKRQNRQDSMTLGVHGMENGSPKDQQVFRQIRSINLVKLPKIVRSQFLHKIKLLSLSPPQFYDSKILTELVG